MLLTSVRTAAGRESCKKEHCLGKSPTAFLSRCHAGHKKGKAESVGNETTFYLAAPSKFAVEIQVAPESGCLCFKEPSSDDFLKAGCLGSNGDHPSGQLPGCRDTHKELLHLRDSPRLQWESKRIRIHCCHVHALSQGELVKRGKNVCSLHCCIAQIHTDGVIPHLHRANWRPACQKRSHYPINTFIDVILFKYWFNL